MPSAILLNCRRLRFGSLLRNASPRSCLPTTAHPGAFPQIRTIIRLIKSEQNGDLTLVEHNDDEIPQYAILSHTWGADGDEVTFKDLLEGRGKNKAGYRKIEFCRAQASRDGLKHFWVDTCCIDKSSSAELTEAINSMFHWYRNADKCYAYLSDVLTSAHATSARSSSTTLEAAFRKSRWFSRGWTLQELIAPLSVEFFSQDGDRLGSKKSLEQDIHKVTGVAIEALRGAPLADFTIEERFSWANHRATKRQEDKAYSLLGLFDIYMPLLYGEGEEKAFIRLREEIGKSLMPVVEPSEILPSPSSTVPFRRDVDFIDRGTLHDCGTLLQQIEQRCTAASRVALVGMGGSGKSQLAIEYCHRLRERSPSTWVFWIHASNIDRIKEGFREIAERVKIPGRTDPKQNIFELVARWLRNESKGTWLLVLDNLDDDNVLSIPQEAKSGAQAGNSDSLFRQPLSAYLPQSENGTILITTRISTVATKLVEPREVIVIDPMTNTDAITLLKKKLLNKHADDHDLAELACLLEYMPLAIVQAAAYIQQKETRYSVRQYIEAFQQNEKRKTSLLNYEAGHLRRDPEAKNSIIITWQISFNDIREKWPLSADLLSLMSYFDRQGIPEEVLRVQLQEDEIQEGGNTKDEDEDMANNGASDASDDDVFEDAVERLRSYSFILIGEDGRTFEMHGLVQLAMRKWLEMHGEEERWKALFSQKLNAVFPGGDYRNWSWCKILFPHAKSAEKQRPTENQSVREWAHIMGKAGWYAWARGDYHEAERMCKHSVGALKKVLGAENIETSYSQGLLAMVYLDQGRSIEAEKIEIQVIETRKRVLGEEHPETLSSLVILASIYWAQGRWKEAEELGLQMMEKTKRVLGEEHPQILVSMNNLALIYRYQGRWKEAEEIGVQVMKTTKRVQGEEHPDTLISMINLVLIYRHQGRWKEAEELGVQLIEISMKVLGEEHPNTLSSMNSLALVYWNQGRWKEAEKLGVQVMQTTKKVLGAEHPSTLTSMANLALMYQNQGRWIEAEKMEMQVVETRRRVQGEEHPDTLTSMANLALTHCNQGRWKEAEELGLRVMETMKRVLGEEHPDTLTNMANLALTHSNQGRWKEAEELGLRVMETMKRVLGEEHPDTLTSISNLASTYWKQGRWKEAEELEVQVMEMTKKVLGAEHPFTLMHMTHLFSTYQNQGRWLEAEKIAAQVMETRERSQGEEHPDTLASINNLALTYQHQGRLEEAEKLQVHVMETLKRVLGEEHPNTLTSMANLVSLYWAQGRWKEAEELGVQIIETSKKVLGEEHLDTLTSMNNLATTYQDQGRWKEAEELVVQVIETRKRALGEEHPDTLTSMSNLASTYWNQGRWKEAEELGLQVMEATKKVLGAEHPSTLISMANLATTYQHQGRWIEAEKMEVQVMEIRRRVLGEEHPDTLNSMHNLAFAIRSQGRTTEAIKLMAECIRLRNEILGAEHPFTLSSAATLAGWEKGG